MLLQRSRIFQSKDLEESIRFIERVSSASIHNARKLKKAADAFLCSHVCTEKFHMFYIASNMDATMNLYPVNYIRLFFQIEGFNRVLIEGHEIIGSPQKGGYIIPEGVLVKDEHPDGYKSLVLRVHPEALKQRLETLAVTKIAGSIKFEQPVDMKKDIIGFLRQAVFNTAHEIDATDSRFHSYILEELNSVVLTRLLLHLPHNYSHLLEGKTPSIDPVKISKVENYIHTHHGETLNLELLSTIGGISGRSIQRHFRKMHNVTPHEYIQRVRLDLVRKKLLSKTEGDSVLSVALSCGFKSFGHFAELYKGRFGELPSETRKRQT